MPVLLLDHVGRKSGKKFTTPLLYLEDGPDLVVVASQGGMAKNPQWYHNLQRAARRPRCRCGPSCAACGPGSPRAEERAALWPRLVDLYADFDTYQAWTDREIPVVVLEAR